MDFKTSLEKYRLMGANDVTNLIRSLEVLRKGNVDYELRNTTVPTIVTEEDIPKMGETVRGARRFAFQQFVPGETLDKTLNSIKPYTPEVIGSFAKIMANYVQEVILRI
jgi:pyruvate formate lyase activating enzyme